MGVYQKSWIVGKLRKYKNERLSLLMHSETLRGILTQTKLNAGKDATQHQTEVQSGILVKGRLSPALWLPTIAK